MAKIQLSKIDTRAPKKLNKDKIKQKTADLIQRFAELQEVMFAEHKHSLLVLIQGMDASGKDGAIKDIFSGINPMGVQIKSWKAPTEEELNHDFLWRIHRHVPEKGMIQVHNRSHYEDVLVTLVHGWCDDATAQKRYNAINAFENLLQEHNNTIILKFYLHVSHEEQLERLAERTVEPHKRWKYNAKDMEESKLWEKYMKMYHAAFNACNIVPWHIIPSDQNWYKNYLIISTIVDTLEKLNMQYPTPSN